LEGLVIREMLYEDLSAVHAIENLSFTAPWQLNSFISELGNSDAVMKVAVFSGKVAGYVCIRAILDSAHVLDLAVIPECRRMGLGGLLLKNALQEIRISRPELKSVTLEVRESNIEAIRLYEKFGFTETGRRRGYYQRPIEDAVIMERDMDINDLHLPSH